jgi:hypothetical protein
MRGNPGKVTISKMEPKPLAIESGEPPAHLPEEAAYWWRYYAGLLQQSKSGIGSRSHRAGATGDRDH